MGMGMLMFLSLHPQQFNWRRRERCPFFLRHQPSTTGTTSTKRKLEKHDKTSSSHSSASASKSGTLGVDPSTTKHFCSRKQAMLANEKRRRRRESHVVATRNALERRRRVINEKSGELATLIPSVMFGAERSKNSCRPSALNFDAIFCQMLPTQYSFPYTMFFCRPSALNFDAIF
ncbi:hypothetical protein EV361DRAFT_340127 [Lentinula raphanica]|uniref:Uncharacterized protein n=1 Tax=Lentinula raphanica TaxID=153919 RepID=A0AA38UJL4_9AGAR|nr:hypothetical protein F5878DRAFT_163330 [Lentinula raphanica]KAJ3969602.1 hypothetical protein EV361DRAFT_340127 [Lentinula raphanica]